MTGEEVKNIVNSLKEEISNKQEAVKKLQEDIKDLSTAIKSLQYLCPHKYECTGYDSHNDYYTCTYCGDHY